MGLIAALPDIDLQPKAAFVMHEKFERLIPLHQHTKGQLTYIEGGIAYITIHFKTYIVPAHHFFWIPRGMPHLLRVSNSATVVRNIYFYTHDDARDEFYSKLGIYPASRLLLEMIKYTERWDGRHVKSNNENFEFLIALKNILPEMGHKTLPIILPITEDESMKRILRYMESRISLPLTLEQVSSQFNMSTRSLSRFFQARLQISFLQYLKTLRMVKAIEMLLKTQKPISEIALLVGYDSIGSFSNAFFALTQSRPSDFRRV
ncbi:MAG: helix-turn-helix domain-containing protein [Bacteroidetes bacterium]|nr:helix-turn-helix domain-containing protein [Bacteroidota bacterium]